MSIKLAPQILSYVAQKFNDLKHVILEYVWRNLIHASIEETRCNVLQCENRVHDAT